MSDVISDVCSSDLGLKGGLEAHSVDYAALYASEGGFYREFAAIIAPGCPRSWYAPPRSGCAPPYLLLEDLVARGVRFGDAREVLSGTQAEQVLDNLARVHAARRTHELSEHPWLPDAATQVFPTLIEAWTAPAHWAAHLQLPRGQAVTPVLRDADRIRAALHAFVGIRSEEHTSALQSLLRISYAVFCL